MKQDTFPNRDKPIIQIEHFNLNPADEIHPNKWASDCPICGTGILFVNRHFKTFELQEFDRCVSCMQRFQYLDIEDMRRKDGNKVKFEG